MAPGPGWTLDREADRLICTFRGRLTAAEGEASAALVAAELTSSPLHLVFDLTDMQGYESGARAAWQRSLWPLRDRILSLEVVGGNAVVRMGANVLGLALGVPVTSSSRPSSE